MSQQLILCSAFYFPINTVVIFTLNHLSLQMSLKGVEVTFALFSSWPSWFCRRGSSVRLSALSLSLPGSAAETPPFSPSPACALWWPHPAGPAEDRISRSYKKNEMWWKLEFVIGVPAVLSAEARPASPSGQCPCPTPREFSPPTPSGSHCEVTHSKHTNTLIG